MIVGKFEIRTTSGPHHCFELTRFHKLWSKVEHQTIGINAVFTHEVKEESSAEVTNEARSTPPSEILGDEYGFPQTNLSVKPRTIQK